jgi:hypothetical protein
MLIKRFDTLLDWNWGDGIDEDEHVLDFSVADHHAKRHQFLIGFDFRST